MFLSVRKNNGIEYLYLLKSVRVPGQNAPKIKSKISFGKLCKAHERVHAALRDKEERRRLSALISRDFEVGDEEAARRKIATGEWECEDAKETPPPTNLNKLVLLRYGHLALKDIWEKELGLKYKLGYIQRKYTPIETWRLNDLVFYLACLKVLDPVSRHCAYEHKGNFFYCPWWRIGRPGFEAVHDLLSGHAVTLVRHAVTSFLENVGSSIGTIWVTTLTVRPVMPLEDDLCPFGLLRESVPNVPKYAVALAVNQDGFPVDMLIEDGDVPESELAGRAADRLKNEFNVQSVHHVEGGEEVSKAPTKRAQTDRKDLPQPTVGRRLSALKERLSSMLGTFPVHGLGTLADARMKAHGTMCFLSLLMMCSLLSKLEARGKCMSLERMSDVLHKAFVLPDMERSGEILLLNLLFDESPCDAGHDDLPDSKRSAGAGKKEDMYGLDDAEELWKRQVENRQRVSDDLALLLDAADLRPLPRKMSMAEAKRCLGIGNCGDEDTLDGLVRLQLEATQGRKTGATKPCA